eukprot:TRINITY_DN28675_c0_g1_i1.p1 TRINITY_DN28675_c0_g1~~TRINITY_DN28675_c0_g1_i1.p1  ORF type:complete len:605 (+),score=33.18 TRINITY_DN28675_c0_g1_i1:131-1816(+)
MDPAPDRQSACLSIEVAQAMQVIQTDPRTLSTQLPSFLLRAVPLQRALSGYGRHWRSNASSQADFMESVPASGIDDFISHEWGTRRRDKLVALCFLYNSQAALLISTVFTFVVAALRLGIYCLQEDVVPWSRRDSDLFSHSPCVVMTPFVYYGVLMHWHSIRAILLQRTPAVFVDKLCINQGNEEQKQQGILGLAAFLKKSNRLVLLWSPRYFTRLWCTYEVATWFSQAKDASSIAFVPLKVPNLIVLMTGCCTAYVVLLQVVRLVPSLELTDTFNSTVSAPRFFLFLGFSAMVTYHLAALQLALNRVSEDLALFSISDAECFCCSSGHQHPVTRAALPCDRRLVYRTLKSWQPSMDAEDVPDHVFLAAFDQRVRTFLREVMLSLVCFDADLLKYTEIVHGALPFLWLALDRGMLAFMDEAAPAHVFGEVFEGICRVVVIAPLSVTLWLHLMTKRPVRGTERGSRRLLLATFVWGPTFSLLGILLWLPLQVSMTRGAIWVQTPWAIVLLAFLWYVRRSKPADASTTVSEKGCISNDSHDTQPLGKTVEASSEPSEEDLASV